MGRIEFFEVSVVSDDPDPAKGIYPILSVEPQPVSSGMQPQAAKPEGSSRRS